ncbi:MAG: LysM peptidoglycan-binding domain-containing protein [Lentisphaerae bacterium]|nr:LysM peptidoglycan-binding domain-containing protein [Lentisphaerota bacterium]
MKTIVLMLMVVAMTGGCVTLQQQRAEEARRARDVAALKADLYRIKEESGSASAGYEQVYADIARLRTEQADGERALAARLDELEIKLRQQDAAMQAMHKQIVAELSKKVSDVIKSQAPAAGREYGREHLIKQGETLSEIAAAYGVTVNAIVRANGLKDANSIRLGQKLFIPE